ncbi:MAG: S8 family serine peptidase [Geodermatophilaceae bacterium]|nr:S8 family serine peptidase [Geodermatophilaceae bacterium]
MGVPLAVCSAASALVLSGLAGTASAEPVNPNGLSGPRTTLSAEQQAQLRDALNGRVTRSTQLPASGPMAFLLELDSPSTGQVFTDNLPGGQAAAAAAARAAVGTIATLRNRVLGALPQAAPQFTELYRTQATLAGVAIETDVSNFAALSGIPGVKAVYPIAPKKIDNAGAAQLIRANQVWSSLGNTGQGVTVGVIDTGIDYVHTNFGGPGTAAAYAAQTDAATPPASLFPNAKVVGGTDFVGDAYNTDPNDPAYSPVRHPDTNPMDCNGHGSHVAGSAAGYGVNANGSTYRGNYDANIPLNTMRIGPGMAPMAQLFALRVFGCAGSTNATAIALEYSMDPNQDGVTDDHLDVVNLSLGSDFGLADDGDTVIVNRAAELGVSMVLSAGNAGDTFDVGGSPGNAARAITVAASDDGFGIFDGWQIVNKPELFDPDIRPGLRSVLFATPTPNGVQGDLVLPIPGDDPTACAPLTKNAYTGKFLIIEAAGFACGSITKSGNAQAAGAAGFVIVADDDLLESGINGSSVIPGILVRNSDGQVLEEHVAAGETLTIQFGDNLKDAARAISPEQEDLLASFSSRGVRQANNEKPDVTAPGVNTFSTATGTGNQGLSLSGTSMASPTTAGVVALIRSAHPTWTTEEVKAAVMNTANEDLYTGQNRTGDIYAPNRVGAGRIDALDALHTNVVAYVQDAPGVVTASFGVIEATNDVTTMTRTIRVVNKGRTAQTFSVAYDAVTEQPGVSYSLSRSSVTIGPGGSTTVVLTITVRRSQLLKTLDPTMTDTQEDTLVGFGALPRQFVADASGRVVLTASASGSTQPQLRVPVHANAKPSSTLTQTLSSFSGNNARLTLSGRGVRNGTPGAPNAYASLSSAFEQLGTSPQMPKCTRTVTANCYHSDLERSVDLKGIGVATDAPLIASPRNRLRDGFLYFGVAAHGKFTTPDAVIGYSVFIDGNGDNVPDYEIFTQRLANGADGIDVEVVLGADLATGELLGLPDGSLAVEFLNQVPGNVDTNLFDNDTVLMAFPIAAMPLITTAAPRFTFGVQATSFGYGTIDTVGTTPGGTSVAGGMSFNALTPGLSFTSGGAVAQLVVSGPGTRIDVRRNPTQLAADRAVGGPKGILVIHSHNSTTAVRAQTVPLPGVT